MRKLRDLEEVDIEEFRHNSIRLLVIDDKLESHNRPEHQGDWETEICCRCQVNGDLFFGNIFLTDG